MVVLVMTAVLMVAAMVRVNYLILCLVVVFVVLYTCGKLLSYRVRKLHLSESFLI